MSKPWRKMMKGKGRKARKNISRRKFDGAMVLFNNAMQHVKNKMAMISPTPFCIRRNQVTYS